MTKVVVRGTTLTDAFFPAIATASWPEPAAFFNSLEGKGWGFIQLDFADTAIGVKLVDAYFEHPKYGLNVAIAYASSIMTAFVSALTSSSLLERPVIDTIVAADLIVMFNPIEANVTIRPKFDTPTESTANYIFECIHKALAGKMLNIMLPIFTDKK